ncbi:MAG: thiamine biosynthesis lipoprotein [Sphingobacteriales bacterium]|jgi:thiamine biosynthesis lipoprotein
MSIPYLRSMNKIGILFGLLSGLVFTSCQNNATQIIRGEAQGTSYFIKFFEGEQNITKGDVDSILQHFDNAVSWYNPNSLLSHYNAADTFVHLVDTFGYFSNVYYHGFRFQNKTQGYFNPGLLPFFQALKKNQGVLSAAELDSLMALGSMTDNKVKADINPDNHLMELDLWKDQHEQLDFNANAQGFSVDLLAEFLQKKGIGSFLVEIGGEMRVGIEKPNGTAWEVGIENPVMERSGNIQEVLQLNNWSLATSGTYRKFVEGKHHIINPLTGKQTNHNLVSVTVIAELCADADALATAFIAMGKDKSMEWLQTQGSGKEYAFFIENINGEWVSSYSPGFEKFIQKDHVQ